MDSTPLRIAPMLAVLLAAPSSWSQPAPPAQPPPPAQAASVAPCVAPSTPLPQPSRECPPTGLRAVGLRAGRVGVEVLLGALFGAALGAGGAYAGLLGDVAAGNEAGVGLGVGAAVGVMLGAAPGVWLGGYAMGGDGSFGWGLLGSAVGTGLSAGLLAIDATAPSLVFATLLPVAGAVVGYELSSQTRRPSRSTSSARVAPWIGARGVGLAGAF